jgi:hypothetical protein
MEVSTEMPYPNYAGGGMYRGDIYRGGFLGSVGKAIGGAVKGFVTGGPMGALTGVAGALVKKPSGASMPMVQQQGIVGTAVKVGTKLLPGILGGVAVEKGIDFLTGRGGRKRYRRMNALNPRALTRATRRLHGFHSKSKKALRELGYTVVRTGTARGGGKKRRCA